MEPGSASSPSMVAAPRLGAEAGAQWRLPAARGGCWGRGEEEEEEDERGRRGRRGEKQEEDANVWREWNC